MMAIELKSGASLRFQSGFISEVDGLRKTCTKPLSPSHGPGGMEVILSTNCGSGKHCSLLLCSPSGLSESESFTPSDKHFNDSNQIPQPL